jgi:chloramphenicol O-acetyltransferase type A
MSRYLDLETWSRKELFDFFIGYAHPYFNVTAQIEVTNLREFIRARKAKLSHVLHYCALRAANEIEPFRYRLKDGKVFVYDKIDGGTTVLLPNESFSYAYFDFDPDFAAFANGMEKAVTELISGTGKLKPTMRDDVIYHTTLPWISFTSFAHARTGGRGESIPRIVFGKITNSNERQVLPISVEVHHALMDGLHVGRFLEHVEKAFSEPESFIVGPT